MKTLAAALLAASLAFLPVGCSTVPPLPAEGDWTWQGKHRIDRFIEVPAGVTLRLLPGTTIAFAWVDGDGDGDGDAGLHVRGKIVAAGTGDRPIVLTSAERDPRPGDWAGLLLDDSRGSVFERVTIEYARHALHSHFSEGRISKSRIVRNIEGTRLGDSSFVIEDSLIAGNVSKGLNFRACANRITGNTITENGNGIFLFETDSDSVVERNNIFGNEVYDLRLGDFYTGRFTVGHNWWGTADEGRIRERIFEGEAPGDRGRVSISPAPAPWPSEWKGL